MMENNLFGSNLPEINPDDTKFLSWKLSKLKINQNKLLIKDYVPNTRLIVINLTKFFINLKIIWKKKDCISTKMQWQKGFWKYWPHSLYTFQCNPSVHSIISSKHPNDAIMEDVKWWRWKWDTQIVM